MIAVDKRQLQWNIVTTARKFDTRPEFTCSWLWYIKRISTFRYFIAMAVSR